MISNASITDVGDFAMAISLQDVASWTDADLEELLMEKDGDNPVLVLMHLDNSIDHLPFDKRVFTLL